MLAFVTAGDTQESSKVTHVKGILLLLLVRVQGPGLTTIEKRASAQHTGLVHPDHGVESQHMVLSDTLFARQAMAMWLICLSSR